MQKERVASEIGIDETKPGKELNQEISLIQVGDKVVAVVKYVKDEGSNLSNRNQAKGILSYFKTLDFMFLLHLMLETLCLTDTLSKHLQKKDQNILEVASLLKPTKKALLNIGIVGMSEYYVTLCKRRTNKTNQHHFEVVIFNTILDMQIQEFRDRFSEVGTKLMENIATLSPCDSFSSFDKTKLLKLSEIYKNDFDDSEMAQLNGQLDIYYHSLLHDVRFFNLKGIANLSRLLVETEKHLSFPLVYRLLKLTLVLPVATAIVERCFSTMKFLTNLRNKIDDDFMNDAFICSVEKKTLENVKMKMIPLYFDPGSTTAVIRTVQFNKLKRIF
ncbi:uncharacterized protein LOC111882135 [Lactuca sativa]|uniref:uncharacterized protein LOC111882135 n=1 Tax=Lactuca sativa TaxID=4236 RepID=UPI000CD9969F|nr:uncharacterized protein LOC111882135 [Lactuca sativa]